MLSAGASQPDEDFRRLQMVADFAESIAMDRFGGSWVDPVGIIDSCPGLTWSAGSYGDHFDGLIESDGRRFHIYMNEDRCARIDGGRGAFTLAHELGHFFIDEHHHWLKAHPHRSHCSFVLQDDVLQKPHEREADVFATNLLLPRKPFQKLVGCPTPGGDVIIAAADHFHTTLSSTAIRFTELEPFPCAVIKWEQGMRKWAKRSPRVARQYGDVARRLDGVLAESLTAQALRGEITITSPLKRTTVAEAWFPRLEQTADRWASALDLCVALDEHVISLGRFGFLTLLCGHAWTCLGMTAKGQNVRVAGK